MTVELDRPAMVILKSTYDNRWQVTVDGNRVEPQMVAPSFVGRTLPAGRHTVEFRYAAFPWYGWLLGLAIAAELVLVLWWRLGVAALESWLGTLSEPQTAGALPSSGHAGTGRGKRGRRGHHAPRSSAGALFPLSGGSMPNAEKIKMVETIKGRIAASEAILLADYRGLSVHDATELRRSLASQAKFTVVKNTLLKRAADESGMSELDALLTGPTAVAFVSGDVVAAAKQVVDAAKRFPPPWSSRVPGSTVASSAQTRPVRSPTWSPERSCSRRSPAC